ncbi:hypothetical protein [Neisseria arctica]|nr:hypothetical protein [Neisseria arctica]UOO87056.1 hypothetical protein LVJ86_02040 [Neisseria arctica]
MPQPWQIATLATGTRTMNLLTNTRVRARENPLLDTGGKPRQYSAIGFNQPTSRGKLAQIGRQAAGNSNSLSGVFTSAYPLVLPFAMVGGGKVRPSRAGSICRFSTPCPLLAAHRVETESGKEAKSKGTIMPKIRKGYSRPLISRSIRSFDSLAEAGRFIDRLTSCNANDYRFNIVQNGTRWTVCNVISGGVQ